MANYRINEATKTLYDFIWHDYCDWYVEITKNRLNNTDDQHLKSAILNRTIAIFESVLKLLHPFMPFITEELWHHLANRNDGESISVQMIPQFDETSLDEQAEREMAYLQNVIEAVRAIRGEMNVPITKMCDVVVHCHDEQRVAILQRNAPFLQRLARVEHLNAGIAIEKPRHSSSAVVMGDDVFVPLEGLIDVEKEIERLQKEITRHEGMIQGVERKLHNPDFINRAPNDVVEKERAKLENFQRTLEKLQVNLSELTT
jgi:valyl-tRNA synthetase